jgi:hypothetical protein
MEIIISGGANWATTFCQKYASKSHIIPIILLINITHMMGPHNTLFGPYHSYNLVFGIVVSTFPPDLLHAV